MSITVRKTSKGLTIRTTGDDAERLLAHLARAGGVAAAPVPPGMQRAGVLATTVNVRVRTKAQGT